MALLERAFQSLPRSSAAKLSSIRFQIVFMIFPQSTHRPQRDYPGEIADCLTMWCVRIDRLRCLNDLASKCGETMNFPWESTRIAHLGPSQHFCLVQQKRWRSKINLKYPRSPHELKRKMLHAAKPIFATHVRPPSATCLKLIATSRELPYNQLEVLLARWARQVMDEAEVVVLVHCNPTSVNTHKDFQNRVWKMNIRLWEKFPNRVLDCAVTDTKYEIMKPFVKEGSSNAMIITSSEMNFINLVKGLKWMTSYVPLLTIVNGDRVVSYPQLQAYAKSITGDIGGLHYETSANLSHSARNISKSIQHQYFTLSQSLDHLVKQ